MDIHTWWCFGTLVGYISLGPLLSFRWCKWATNNFSFIFPFKVSHLFPAPSLSRPSLFFNCLDIAKGP